MLNSITGKKSVENCESLLMVLVESSAKPIFDSHNLKISHMMIVVTWKCNISH